MVTIGPLDAEGAGVLIAGAVSDGLERRPEAGAGVTWVSRLALSRTAERHSSAPSIRICLNPEWVPARPTPVGRASTSVLFRTLIDVLRACLGARIGETLA